MTTAMPPARFQHLVVGYDGSPPVSRALDAAARQLQGRPGRIDVVYVAHLSSLVALSPGAVAEMEEDFDEIEKDLRAQADEQLRGSGAAWEFERRQGTIADQLIAGAPPSAKPTRMRTWRSSSAARPTPLTAWSVRSRSAWPATRRCPSSSCPRGSRAQLRPGPGDQPSADLTDLRRSHPCPAPSRTHGPSGPGYNWEADSSPVAFHPGLRSRSISSGGRMPMARIPARIRTA